MIKSRQKYRDDISNLTDDTYKMADITLHMLKDAINALIKDDKKQAKDVIKFDDKIDSLYRKIEHRCIKLLATQQPMAKDLRKIAGVLKIITDIERIGDYSVDIAKGTKYLIRPLSPSSSKKLSFMVDTIDDMFDDCFSALKTKKTAKLKKIVVKDDLVDKNFGKICDHVVDRLLDRQTESHGQHEITVLLAGRHLERIADHITNICERIYFIIKGDRLELHDK